jgi:hypothetical protein
MAMKFERRKGPITLSYPSANNKSIKYGISYDESLDIYDFSIEPSGRESATVT